MIVPGGSAFSFMISTMLLPSLSPISSIEVGSLLPNSSRNASQVSIYEPSTASICLGPFAAGPPPAGVELPRPADVQRGFWVAAAAQPVAAAGPRPDPQQPDVPLGVDVHGA